MTTISAIAIVMAIVQFVKKALPKLNITGPVAIALTVVASICVTVYKYISEGLPLTFAAIVFCVEVIVGANGAYNLIKVAAPSTPGA
jgi:hypothetical protein